MRKICAAISVVALIAPLALLSAQSLGEYQPSRAPETVYAQTCGYCHGRNVGPIILGRQLPAEYIKVMARNGRGGMPAFRQTEITPDELDRLAVWIAASSPSATEHGN